MGHGFSQETNHVLTSIGGIQDHVPEGLHVELLLDVLRAGPVHALTEVSPTPLDVVGGLPQSHHLPLLEDELTEAMVVGN